MKNKLFAILFYFYLNTIYSQVGINTADPKATLDVVGQQSVSSEVDGIIPPRITRQNLINKTVYGNNQIGALIYITDLSGVNNSTTITIDEIGYYFFDGSKWQKVLAGTKNIIGDVKQGFQTSDHSGWIKLDGRAKSTLTTNQQAQATALGIGTNLPDATDKVLKQKTNVNITGGSNSVTILQANLPNINLTTSTNGNHTHAVPVTGQGSYNRWGVIKDGLGDFYGQHYRETSVNGDHNHTSLLGGSDTPLNIENAYLSVNMFIYLGN